MGPQTIRQRLVQAKVLRKLGRHREADTIHDGLISALARKRSIPEEQESLRLLEPDAIVEGCPLGTELRACVCASRQAANEIKSGVVLGTRRRGKGGRSETARKRGISREYPSCVTELCPVGRKVRAQLAGVATMVRHGLRRDAVSLYEARVRQERVTVEAPTIDDYLGDEPG